MTCPFCALWNQTDPNCGHVMLGDVLLPASYVTRDWTLAGEISSRAKKALDVENTSSHAIRTDHIERQVGYARAGGWRKASA